MAPRAYWKGYLKLSLVSCPVALFPASSEREKISFNQINKKTGNRIRYRKVDAETEEEIDSSEIIKGYQVGKGQYIEIGPEELCVGKRMCLTVRAKSPKGAIVLNRGLGGRPNSPATTIIP